MQKNFDKNKILGGFKNEQKNNDFRCNCDYRDNCRINVF